MPNLMITFRDILSDLLHDRLQFSGGANDPALYQLKLRRNRSSKFLHLSLVRSDVSDCISRVWVLADQVKFASDGMKDVGEMDRPILFSHEQCCMVGIKYIISMEVSIAPIEQEM